MVCAYLNEEKIQIKGYEGAGKTEAPEKEEAGMMEESDCLALYQAELEEIEELSEEDMKTVGELVNRVEEIVPELHREERKFDVSRLLDALSMGNGMER